MQAPIVRCGNDYTIAFLLQQNLSRVAFQLRFRPVAHSFTYISRRRVSMMVPKQATLGYVKPTQSTLGCVGGACFVCKARFTG